MDQLASGGPPRGGHSPEAFPIRGGQSPEVFRSEFVLLGFPRVYPANAARLFSAVVRYVARTWNCRFSTGLNTFDAESCTATWRGVVTNQDCAFTMHMPLHEKRAEGRQRVRSVGLMHLKVESPGAHDSNEVLVRFAAQTVRFLAQVDA